MPIAISCAVALGAAYYHKQQNSQSEEDPLLDMIEEGEYFSRRQQTAVLKEKRRRAMDIASKQLSAGKKTFVALMPMEQNVTLWEHPITTITVVKDGVNSFDSVIEQRVKLMMKHNPWLGGWLALGPKPKIARKEEATGEDDPSFSSASSLNMTSLTNYFRSSSTKAAKDDKESKVMGIWYDPTAQECAPDVFHQFSSSDISLPSDLSSKGFIEANGEDDGNERLFRKCMVKDNLSILDNPLGEALWKVGVLPILQEEEKSSPSGNCAIVMSMSHAIGDAFTYYKLLEMLLSSEKDCIGPLQPERLYNTFPSELNQIMGADEATFLLQGTGGIETVPHADADDEEKREKDDEDENITDSERLKQKAQGFLEGAKTLLYQAELKASEAIEAAKAKLNSEESSTNVGEEKDRGALFSQADSTAPLLESGIFVINRGWLEQEKENALKDSVPNNVTHISDNDILTSWFFTTCGHVDVGLVPLNFRERTFEKSKDTIKSSVRSTHAGNYTMPLPLTKKEYSTPLCIRKTITSGSRLEKKSGDLRKLLKKPSDPKKGFQLGIFTNWSNYQQSAATKKEASTGVMKQHVPYMPHVKDDLLFLLDKQQELIHEGPTKEGTKPMGMHVGCVFSMDESKLGLYVVASPDTLEAIKRSDAICSISD